jgi:hypothetical protein
MTRKPEYGTERFRTRKENFDSDERRKGKWHQNKRWQGNAGDSAFRCANCRQMVFASEAMGTAHRNHCPWCLWSLHVDAKPGNRASLCRARMEPVGLTFRHGGIDRYGREKAGDVMLVHLCTGCAAVNINRIAADDLSDNVLTVFERSLTLDAPLQAHVTNAGIALLRPDDLRRLRDALFGRRGW